MNERRKPSPIQIRRSLDFVHYEKIPKNLKNKQRKRDIGGSK